MNRNVVGLIAFAIWIGAANHVSAAALGALLVGYASHQARCLISALP